MSWKTEFPDMDNITLIAAELEQAGFSDESWHNDEGPRFEKHSVIDGQAVTITVWVGYKNPDYRVSPYQFGMSVKHSGSDIDVADIGTNSWAMMQALIKA